jgi:general secretion pathway protein F
MEVASRIGEPILAKEIKQSFVQKHIIFNRFSDFELSNIFKEFAMIIDTGLPVYESVKALEENSKEKKLIEFFSSVSIGLDSGFSLSKSLKESGFLNDNMIVNLIAIGEKSGELSKSLLLVSTIKENSENIYTKVKNSIRYPLLVFFVFIIALFCVVIFILPKFNEIFSSYNQTLPYFTKFVFYLIDDFLKHGYLILLYIIGILLLFSIVFYQKAIYIIDYIKLKIPVLKEVIHLIEMYKFFVSFKLLFDSGVTLDYTMNYSIQSISNRYLQNRFKVLTDFASEGISKSFGQLDFLDGMIVKLLVLAEKSGDFSKAVENILNIIDFKLNRKIDNFAFILENFLVFLISTFVLFLALVIFLPLWNLSSITSF